MKLFTITDNKDYDVEAYSGIYLKRVDYSYAQYQEFIKDAQKYYIQYEVEDDSTDFNDRYHSSYKNNLPINRFNMVIEDGKFYGAFASGYIHKYIIVSFDKPKLEIFDGSVYSSTEYVYCLKESNLPTEALEFVQKYYIHRDSVIYKMKDGKEVFDLESHDDYFLLADNVILENGVAVGLLYNDLEFRINDVSSLEQKVFEDKTLGAQSYHYYYTYTLKKWNDSSE